MHLGEMKFKQRGREEQAEADGSAVCYTQFHSSMLCFALLCFALLCSALLCYTFFSKRFIENSKKNLQLRSQQEKTRIYSTYASAFFCVHCWLLRLQLNAAFLLKLILAEI